MNGLMGNGWADAWMDGLMGGWHSSFILGFKEAMYILHWQFLGSNVYLLDTGTRGGYPSLRGLPQRFLRNRTLSWRYTMCSVLNWGMWGQLGEMMVQEECPKGHLELNLEKATRSRKGFPGRGGPAWTQQSQETSGQKIKRHQDSLLLGQEHGTEEWCGWGWKVRQEPKVDPPCLHTSALSLRKSGELIRQVLKVSKAEWLGTLKWLNELLPRNLIWHKSIFFFHALLCFHPVYPIPCPPLTQNRTQTIVLWTREAAQVVRLSGCKGANPGFRCAQLHRHCARRHKLALLVYAHSSRKEKH